jgi:hypothetical protein
MRGAESEGREFERRPEISSEGGVMTKLRSAVSQEEEHAAAVGPTTFRTTENRHELRCGMCSEIYFVDAATFDSVSTAVQEGLDNPFLCEDCVEEYDELAYEG